MRWGWCLTGSVGLTTLATHFPLRRLLKRQNNIVSNNTLPKRCCTRVSTTWRIFRNSVIDTKEPRCRLLSGRVRFTENTFQLSTLIYYSCFSSVANEASRNGKLLFQQKLSTQSCFEVLKSSQTTCRGFIDHL